MHCLELCGGANASMSRVAKELGWHVTTLDWNPKVSGLPGSPHLCCDVKEFDYTAHRPLTAGCLVFARLSRDVTKQTREAW